jgi:hypothetical protein
MFHNQSSTSALPNNWKQLGNRVIDHETSSAHGNALVQLLELQKGYHYEKTIDNFQQRQINAEKITLACCFKEDYCLRSIFGRQ